MIIRKLPRLVILTVDRLMPGDIVYGRPSTVGPSGLWVLFQQDEIFKVTHNTMSIGQAAQRVSGKTIEGQHDTWILIDFGSHMLVEDNS